jgi:crotonobetaine/carnitine-CoA ligase
LIKIEDYPKERRSLGRLLADQAEKFGNKVFVQHQRGTLTYAELNGVTNRIANSLRAAGVEKGDKVAVMLPNCPEFIAVQFAVAKAGAVQVPINVEQTPEMIAYTVDNCDAKTLIIDGAYLPKLLADRLPKIKNTFVRGKANALCRAYDDLLLGSDSAVDSGVQWHDPVAIFYTSGTTGVSKGVVLPHNHHFDFGCTLLQCSASGFDDVWYICAPYYHGLAQYMSTVPAMLAGGSVALAERFSASRFWSDIRKYRATVAWMVYTMAPILLRQPERPEDADNPLRVYYTVGIAASLIEPLEKRFGVNVVQMLGSTEQGAVVCAPYGTRKIGAAGLINTRDFDVRIVDEFDEELPVGSAGEYVSRTKRPFVRMMEYFKMPEATAAAMRNLWLHSGDAARIDAEGWVYFEGRLKDSIRRGGENISAFELEAVAGTYIDIAECAALAIPSELGEDEIKLCIVQISTQPFDFAGFIAFSRQKMPKYMVPRYLEIMPLIPKTGTGKVEKVKLQKLGLTPQTWDAVTGGYIPSA